MLRPTTCEWERGRNTCVSGLADAGEKGAEIRMIEQALKMIDT